MELLMLYGIVGVPLILIYLFIVYKERQEARKEQNAANA
jgi:hypothetical protein